jgi:hypothetical protein
MTPSAALKAKAAAALARTVQAAAETAAAARTLGGAVATAAAPPVHETNADGFG